ncbi:MAG: Amuc_1098 family type IV pilus outer membrane protein [Verrucomicrobiota bacterium]
MNTCSKYLFCGCDDVQMEIESLVGADAPRDVEEKVGQHSCANWGAAGVFFGAAARVAIAQLNKAIPAISQKLGMAGMFSAVYKRRTHQGFFMVGAARITVLWAVILVFGAVEWAAGDDLLENERERRRDRVIAAEEALLRGDESYEAGRFEEAVNAYRDAYAQLPQGDQTWAMREAAKERYAQAAVQAARTMNREGRREDAVRLMDEVLNPAVFPTHVSAQQMRAKLDDPIRTNPVATPEHVQAVDEVRRLLYQAEGAFNLGNFDQASSFYERVLLRDPYNKAARRGLERTAQEISGYARTAFDQTRAQMLKDVDAAWELKENELSTEIDTTAGMGLIGREEAGLDIVDKLDRIVVPLVDFEETTVAEAVEYLEAISRTNDVGGDGSGISFVVNFGDGSAPEAKELAARRFSVRLRNVPLRTLLDYVTRQTGTQYRVDSYAVVLTPLGRITDELVVRRYRVPPTFLSQSSSGGGEVSDDPFAEVDGSENRLARRLTAQQYLEQQGVDFPAGATATYYPALGELAVKNTITNQDLVDRIVNAALEQEPVQVVLETRIVRVSQTNLEELSIDSTLGRLAADGRYAVSGGTQGNARSSDFLTGGNPLTLGNRSGDFAVQGDAISAVLARERRQVPSGTFSNIGGTGTSNITSGTGTTTPDLAAAPGFLSLFGTLDETAVAVLFRGLDQKKGVDVMSKPSVVTRSGEQALIESVRDFIYPTEYEPPEVPNSIGNTTLIAINGNDVQSFTPSSFSATPSHPTAFETRKIGTSLEVLPVVSPDRSYVEVALTPTIIEFLGFVNYGEPIQGGSTSAGFSIGAGGVGIDVEGSQGEVTSNDILMPLFNRISANSKLVIANGHTVLMGGLLSETVENVEDKTPILGDLPFIGRAFRSDVLQREKKVVMIFVTVRIVDPSGRSYQN